MKRLHAWGWLVLLAGAGCAPTLSTLQTGRTLERGQVQVSTGLGLFVPAGPLATVADQGIRNGQQLSRAIREGQPINLSEEDQQALLAAGIALGVAPPGTNYELAARVGVAEGADVGLRLSTSAVRLDGKLRLLHRGDPDTVPENQRRSVDVALGVGVSRHLFRSPVIDLLELVEVGDFSRYDVEVPLYLSAEVGDIFKVYGAPKYVYAHTRMDERLVAVSQQGQQLSGFDVELPARVDSHFVGASVGLALGYRFVHFFAELTAGYTFCNPVVLGSERNLGGVTLFPALGLAFKAPAPGRAAGASSSRPPATD